MYNSLAVCDSLLWYRADLFSDMDSEDDVYLRSRVQTGLLEAAFLAKVFLEALTTAPCVSTTHGGQQEVM